METNGRKPYRGSEDLRPTYREYRRTQASTANEKGCLAGMAVIFGISITVYLLIWPLLKWHEHGSRTPSATGYIVWALWLGIPAIIGGVIYRAQKGSWFWFQ